MTCSTCGASPPPGARFCGECGTPVSAGCPACGIPVPPGQRFCHGCGTALAAAAPAPRVADPPPVAERRVCSILFVDLVGFTPLSETRDAEDVRELLSRYFELARTVITRYGGAVEKFIGDAVMAVWGAPVAGEGDAERAVRAGLELVDAVAALGVEVGAPSLRARGGVVTGEVAVTLGATSQGMVAGDPVNTAARVQATAEPGTVLADEATWRLAQAGIAFTPAGLHEVKGKADAIALWQAGRVLSAVGGAQRVDGLEAPFVGRDAELRLVKELFHATADRRAVRLVSVTGPAGVGKSRLGWEFEKYIDGLGFDVRWHRGRCLSYGDGVAFWALAEMVRQRLAIAEEDPPATVTAKLQEGLERWLSEPAERAFVAPRLGRLLGLDGDQALSREELFAGWRLFFERLAATGPVVMLIEDLHWADAGLLDFLEHLLDWSRDAPIFVLTFARPELETRRAGWGAGRRNTTTLYLEPLDGSGLSALLDALVPGMPAEAKTAIASRAEGVPLYAVETIRMLIDRDVVQPVGGVYRLIGDVGQLAVPATLQSLLAARLDALGVDERRLVADAAVLGGSFPREALAAVSGLSTEELEPLLGSLVRREVLAVRADPLSPERGQYAFVQTMFRQVAYDTLSRRDRKARHLAVAAHLESVFAGEGDEIIEVVARHYLDALEAVPTDPDAADIRREAISRYTRAGERAQALGAPVAAETAYDTAARLRAEGDDETAAVDAAELRERAGLMAQFSGRLGAALEHFAAAAAAYRDRGLAHETARAEANQGRILSFSGRHDEARPLLRHAVEVLREQPGADVVHAMGTLAGLEIFAGDKDGDRIAAEGLDIAQARGLGVDVLTEILVIRGLGHGFNNRVVEATAYFREAIRRGESGGIKRTVARAYLNLCDALLGDNPAQAVEAARKATRAAREIGDAGGLSFAVANLASALLVTGEWDEAARVLTEDLGSERPEGDPGALANMLIQVGARRGDLATLESAMPIIERYASSDNQQDIAAVESSRATAAAARGDLAAALEHARAALECVPALGGYSEALRLSWPLAVDVACELGDATELARLIEWLDAYPPGHIPTVLRAERTCARARLATLTGEDPEALFAEAIASFRGLTYPYAVASTLLQLAEWEAGQGRAESARAHAEEALATFRRLGAAPAVARTEALLARTRSVGATT